MATITGMVPSASKYLQKSDLEEGEMVLTVRGFKQIEVDNEKRVGLFFTEIEKPLILNKTNAVLLAEAVGADDPKVAKGKQVTLYVDPSIMFSGKRVGGIRIRAAEPNDDLGEAFDGGDIQEALDEDIPF